MGRKIKGRKHRGVRDPEVQRATREAKLKGKINSAPINPDDQEIPKKMRMISQFMSNKTTPKKKATVVTNTKQKKTIPKKKKLLDSGASNRKSDGEMGTKPLRTVPRFQQMPGESQYHFFRRVDRKVSEVIKRQSYEKKFNVQVTEDPVTGKQIFTPKEKDEEELAKEEKRRKAIMKKKGIVIRTKEEKLQLLRERRKLRKLKKKGKLPLQQEEVDSDVNENDGRLKDFAQLQDKVQFNEVVHAPPSITLKNNKLDINLQDPEARRPASKEGLLVKAMLNGPQKQKEASKKKNNSSNMSLAQKQILERERTRVIEQYRALKRLKHKEGLTTK